MGGCILAHSLLSIVFMDGCIWAIPTFVQHGHFIYLTSPSLRYHNVQEVLDRMTMTVAMASILLIAQFSHGR